MPSTGSLQLQWLTSGWQLQETSLRDLRAARTLIQHLHQGQMLALACHVPSSPLWIRGAMVGGRVIKQGWVLQFLRDGPIGLNIAMPVGDGLRGCLLKHENATGLFLWAWGLYAFYFLAMGSKGVTNVPWEYDFALVRPWSGASSDNIKRVDLTLVLSLGYVFFDTMGQGQKSLQIDDMEMSPFSADVGSQASDPNNGWVPCSSSVTPC